MALVCSLGRISPFGVKVYFPKNLKDFLEKPKNSVIVSRFLNYRFKPNNDYVGKVYSQILPPRQYFLHGNVAKKFGVSAPRLGEHKGHDHSKIWNLERLLSVLLVPLTPAALISPCQQLDTALALLMVMHTHFGLEAIVVDYIRPILFGNLAPKIGLGLLYVFSVVTFAGLLNLIYNDNGLANSIISIWKK